MGDQQRVVRLSAILRVADSLNRDHVQRIERATAMIGEDETTLHLEGSGGLLLEDWSFKKKPQLFNTVFGRTVRLSFAHNAAGPAADA